eukprot:scaffold144083_cov44-Attheya_sp.AAC.1
MGKKVHYSTSVDRSPSAMADDSSFLPTVGELETTSISTKQRAQKTLHVDCILPSTIFAPLGRKHCNGSVIAHDIVTASLS